MCIIVFYPELHCSNIRSILCYSSEDTQPPTLHSRWVQSRCKLSNRLQWHPLARRTLTARSPHPCTSLSIPSPDQRAAATPPTVNTERRQLPNHPYHHVYPLTTAPSPPPAPIPVRTVLPLLPLGRGRRISVPAVSWCSIYYRLTENISNYVSTPPRSNYRTRLNLFSIFSLIY